MGKRRAKDSHLSGPVCTKETAGTAAREAESDAEETESDLACLTEGVETLWTMDITPDSVTPQHHNLGQITYLF